MTSADQHSCTERRNCEGELADQTQPRMAAVLENLIHSAERAAHDKALSNEQLFALVLECEKSIELLKVLMAKDGLENTAEETQPRLKEPEAELMRQADRSLKRFIRELSERKQQIACELSSMRLTQRAAKAYHGISGP